MRRQSAIPQETTGHAAGADEIQSEDFLVALRSHTRRLILLNAGMIIVVAIAVFVIVSVV